MDNKIYFIPNNEKIGVVPFGYSVEATNSYFETRTVAWFKDESMAEKFAQFLCIEHDNQPDWYEESSQWAKEIKEDTNEDTN